MLLKLRHRQGTLECTSGDSTAWTSTHPCIEVSRHHHIRAVVNSSRRRTPKPAACVSLPFFLPSCSSRPGNRPVAAALLKSACCVMQFTCMAGVSWETAVLNRAFCRHTHQLLKTDSWQTMRMHLGPPGAGGVGAGSSCFSSCRLASFALSSAPWAGAAAAMLAWVHTSVAVYGQSQRCAEGMRCGKRSAADDVWVSAFQICNTVRSGSGAGAEARGKREGGRKSKKNLINPGVRLQPGPGAQHAVALSGQLFKPRHNPWSPPHDP